MAQKLDPQFRPIVTPIQSSTVPGDLVFGSLEGCGDGSYLKSSQIIRLQVYIGIGSGSARVPAQVYERQEL